MSTVFCTAAATAFPNLASVTLVGHSAGAQSLQRYAGANKLSMPVKYILANAGTYMYLTDERISKNALSKLNSTCPPAQGTATCSLTVRDFSQPWDGSETQSTLKLDLRSSLPFMIGCQAAIAQPRIELLGGSWPGMEWHDRVFLRVLCVMQHHLAQGMTRISMG